MPQLTQEQRDELLRKRSYALSLFDENTTTEEILKKIYIESMECKSEEQAELMARHVIKTTDMFFSILDLLKDAPGTINEKLNLAFSDLPAEQKAQALCVSSYVFENIESTAKTGSADEGKLKEELEKITQNGTDEGLISKLIQRTVSAAEKTKGILTYDLENQSEEEILGRMIADMQYDPKTMVAVDSMIIYTMSVNGRIEDISNDISLFEITAGVCLNNELKNNQYAAENGNIPPEESSDNFLFCVLSAAIVVCVSAFTGVVFCSNEVALTISALLIGILCVAVCSDSLTSLAYIHFNRCVSCNIFEIPAVKFQKVMHKLWLKLKEKVATEKETEPETEELDINTIYNEDLDSEYDEYAERLYLSLWDDTLPF